MIYLPNTWNKHCANYWIPTGYCYSEYENHWSTRQNITLKIFNLLRRSWIIFFFLTPVFLFTGVSSKQLVPSTCDVTGNVCHGLWVPSGNEGKLFRSGRCSYLCRSPQLPRAGVTNLRINQRASATTQMVTQRRVWPTAGVPRAEQHLNWDWPVAWNWAGNPPASPHLMKAWEITTSEQELTS